MLKIKNECQKINPKKFESKDNSLLCLKGHFPSQRYMTHTYKNMILCFRMIKFLFKGYIVRDQPENVGKICFRNTTVYKLYIIHN